MKHSRHIRLVAALALLLVSTGSVWADNLADIFTNANNSSTRVVIPRRPSIIFIQCHGLNFGDLSCYGQTNFQTPNLDKLAADGVRFNNYTPGDTNMAPVQAALLTGNGSSGVGITIAQVLKDAGYQTGLFGEWYVPGEKPWEQGFDEFGGFLNPNEGTNYYASWVWHYIPDHAYHPANNQWTRWHPGQGPNDGGPEEIYPNTANQKGRYMPDYMLGVWLDNFIKIHRPDRHNHFQPFFLMMNLPAPRSATPGHDDYPVPTDAPYSDEPWPQAAKNRAALINSIDGNIGLLFNQLKQYGMTNNVIIFFSSSAPSGKFHDRRMDFLQTPADRQSLLSGNWAAPMIVYWPDHIPAGRVSEYQWAPQDVLPTISELSFTKPPLNIEGHSVVRALYGK